MNSFTGVELIGTFVQWAVSLLLLLLFVQLPRFGAPRSIVGVWTAAWAAQVVGHLGFLTEAVLQVIGSAQMGPGPISILREIYLPSQFVFLVMVTFGALQATGKRYSPGFQVQVAGAVAVLISLLSLVGPYQLGARLEILATVVVLFGSAQLLIAAAKGKRERGLIFLAVGMVTYATISAVNLLAKFAEISTGTISVIASSLERFSGFGESLALVVFGVGVIVLVVQDSYLRLVSAREARMADLAASEARLNRIIAAAAEAILTVDADGRIELLNDAASRMFGASSARLAGRPIEEIITIHALGSSPQLGRVLLATTAPDTLTGTGRRWDGRVFPVEFTVGPIVAGGIRSAVVIARDLTERQAADAERDRFERRVAESEKMLAIGRVVSGVAHELNNPLAVVLGQSEQLVDATDDPAVRSGLQMINEQALRARHIVKDLLAFVRQREERRERVDLGDLVVRMIAGQQADAVLLRVKLQPVIPSRPVAVRGDRVALEQVVVNLLTNAIHAAERGTVRLIAREVAGEAELIVEDSGPGIPADLVSRVFEPFFTTKRPGEGTGLGLAVSLGLVEQQGGTLLLENRPEVGIGARFVLRMPLDESTVPELTHVVTQGAVPPPPILADGTSQGLLVIDDEPAIRATVARIFGRAGWRVTEADSAETALPILLGASEAELPGLILCDLKMPGMGGKALHERLAAERPEVLTRLIFVTGDVVEADTAAFLLEAGRLVVEKPFTISEMAQMVNQVLVTS